MSRIVGKWRIVEMDLCERDVLDLVGPAYIQFCSDGAGDFGFIAVQGYLDCRYATPEGDPRAEFSWEGDDEGDPVSGRGWARVEPDGSLSGRIFIHLGDDSGFRAIPEGHGSEASAPSPTTR